MKLTPLDIRKHEFTKKLRGYDPVEVKAFTEMVSQQWEEALDELRRAQDRVREMENKISHYEKVEVALQEALESARSGAKRTQDHAEERARLIVEEAELKVEQMLQDAEQERFRLRQDVAKLSHRHDEITARLRHFLMSELEILARHEDDRPIGFMKLVPGPEAEALPPAPEAASSGPEAASGEQRAEDRKQKAPAEAEPAAAAGPAEAAPDPFEHAGAPEPEAAEAPEPEERTTYADLYARAAEAERERPAPAEPGEIEPPEEEDEPTWTLRSIVSGLEGPDAGSPTEKDRIRRILEDLD